MRPRHDNEADCYVDLVYSPDDGGWYWESWKNDTNESRIYKSEANAWRGWLRSKTRARLVAEAHAPA